MIKGVVTDTLQNSLPITNILAKPVNLEIEMAYDDCMEEYE